MKAADYAAGDALIRGVPLLQAAAVTTSGVCVSFLVSQGDKKISPSRTRRRETVQPKHEDNLGRG